MSLTMMRRLRLPVLVIFCFSIAISACYAETIIVGSGSESQVYGNTTKTDNEISTKASDVLISDLTAVLNDLRATTNEKKYLEALSERDKDQENKINQIVRSMDKISRSQLDVIKEQSATIESLNDDIKVMQETSNARMTALELELKKQTYVKYLGWFVCCVFTALVLEIGHSLTRRKRLFFWLRKVRDELPINAQVLLGGRK